MLVSILLGLWGSDREKRWSSEQLLVQSWALDLAGVNSLGLCDIYSCVQSA